jgi:hypothetical protein
VERREAHSTSSARSGSCSLSDANRAAPEHELGGEPSAVGAHELLNGERRPSRGPRDDVLDRESVTRPPEVTGGQLVARLQDRRAEAQELLMDRPLPAA